MTRTFVAIRLDDAVARRAAQASLRLRPHAPSARWVDEDNLHLTLAFLGELTDPQVGEVCAAVEWAARANEPFTIRVGGAGAFPDPLRPRALWLGVTDGAEELVRLQADVAEAVADAAPRAEDRPWRPHITLARLGKHASGPSSRLAEALAALAGFDAGECSVDEVAVLASELSRGGPEYYPLAACPLGPPTRSGSA